MEIWMNQSKTQKRYRNIYQKNSKKFLGGYAHGKADRRI